MIKHLRIKDYTIIDDLQVDFEKGLNVITGETGAGKSVLIDAIDIALGAKASKDIIKTGKTHALIEIEIEIPQELKNIFIEKFQLECDDNLLIITKEITQSSSRSRVNGVLISQNELLEIRKYILDIHSQHQTYTYLQPKTHIVLLDKFGDETHFANINQYNSLYKDYITALQELKVLQANQNDNEQRADFLKFQIDEINSAEIVDANEFDDLTAKVHVLENAQDLKSVSHNAYEALYGENENIADSIDKVKSFLDKVSSHDDDLKEITKELDGINLNLKEVARNLRNYSDNLEYDEDTLNQLQLRLEVLSKIKRKYGGSLEEVLNNLEKFEKEYSLIANSDELLENLQNKIKNLELQLNELAKMISQNRHALSTQLSETVSKAIKSLEMPYAEFKAEIKQISLSQNGTDDVEFMIITNPTEPFKPLAKIASGGEISRIMLAIKTVFANTDDILCVIFDEIDTGVSGKTSQAIANLLSELGKTHQILCITHQPIVAAVADIHLHVTKVQSEENFTVNVQKLELEQRKSIIAKMLSGTENSDSLKLAEEMLLHS